MSKGEMIAVPMKQLQQDGGMAQLGTWMRGASKRLAEAKQGFIGLSLQVGSGLLMAKHVLAQTGAFEAWAKANAPALSQHDRLDTMKLSERFLESVGAPLDRALQVTDGKVKKNQQLVLKFIGSAQTIGDLYIREQIRKAKAKKGGAVGFQAWLKKNYPDWQGAKLRDLPIPVQEEWKAAMRQAALEAAGTLNTDPAQDAALFWDEWIRQTDEEAFGNKHSLVFLSPEQRARVKDTTQRLIAALSDGQI
jgi:hypothetical protein